MHTTPRPESGAVPTSGERPADHPVREYVVAMARELASIARWDGDEALGKLLDGVADVAERSPV
jgi:hypothetical protein